MIEALDTIRNGRFLVIGGAGFVGSHLVAALLDRGCEVVVLDNLSTGHREAVLPGARLVVGDMGDALVLESVLADGPWSGVFHFAALSLVGESMKAPFRYFIENAAKTIGLIESCVRHGVRRLVFSSTAAVYGVTDHIIAEGDAIDPASPYGESKWMIERALYWADRVHGLRYAALRYFNAAGADPRERLGEDHSPETHLIPIVIDVALGRRPMLEIYGSDYPTEDGTCVRDYVHVSDLASMHLLAFARLGQGSVTYNLGNGAGYSVLRVVRTVEALTGARVPFRMAERRPGDPARLVASPLRAHRETGWCPRYTRLDDIVQTALAWREAHPAGYARAPLLREMA
jgi:UDP-glucose 4-epimerase